MKKKRKKKKQKKQGVYSTKNEKENAKVISTKNATYSLSLRIIDE